jgi:PAS domain S-box-containing protein
MNQAAHHDQADLLRRIDALAALVVELERDRTLITHLPGAIYRCACDDDWTMQFISDQVEQICGYPPRDFIASAGRTFASVIHEDDRSRLEQAVHDAVQRRASFDLEYRIRHRDGSIRWLYEKGQGVFDEAGSLLHLEGAVFDITDRKQVELDLDRFFELSPEMLCIAGLDGYFKRLNPAFERTLGYPIRHLLQRPYIEFVHPDDRESTLAQAQRLSEGQQIISFENRYIARDGGVRWLSWTALPVEDEGVIYATARDITGDKLAEQRLEKLQSELAHVSRITTMGELATSLAHEVNQPLYAVCNYIQGCILRLEDDRLGRDELIDTLHLVAREAERAGGIVKHMRDFLRKRPPDPHDADINRVLTDLKVLIEPDARRHKVELAYDLADGLPPVRIDRTQVEQVIVNLVRNAVEAMAEAGSATRRVTLATTRDGDGRVCVSVSDTGPGVSRQAADHLFNAFYTTKAQGMGMGLSISRSIVESHHGRLDHLPAPGGGATFQFRLPAA